MLAPEPALALSLAHEYNQSMHKAKATLALCLEKGWKRKQEFFFIDLVGIGTRKVIVTFSILGGLSQHKVCFSV